jgi:hypothetical protein
MLKGNVLPPSAVPPSHPLRCCAVKRTPDEKEEDCVISSFKNKVQVDLANLMPDSTVAHNIYEQQKRVEQEQLQQEKDH